jgi:hypothetical protein
MDLLGRKLGMKKGAVFMDFMQEVQNAIALARETEALIPLADRVEKALNRLGQVALGLGQAAMSPRIKVAFSFAFPFLDAMGDVIMAWMLLWRAAIAAPKLEKAKPRDREFYSGQTKTAEYFINSILPVTTGKLIAITDGSAAAVEISEDAFGGL